MYKGIQDVFLIPFFSLLVCSYPTSGLERRLKSRVPRERGKGVPEGRTNLKPSEEDFWHKAGVYDYSGDASTRSSNPEVTSREPSCGEHYVLFFCLLSL